MTNITTILHNIKAISSTSALPNIGNYIMSTTACIPSAIRPSVQQVHTIRVINTPDIEWGKIIIKTTGYIEISRGNDGIFDIGTTVGIESTSSVIWTLG